MPQITFTRGETFVATMEDGTTREHQLITPAIDREERAPLEWEAEVPDEIIAGHLGWLDRHGLLQAPKKVSRGG